MAPRGGGVPPRLDLDRLLGRAAPDRLAALVTAYLALPALLFLAGWAAPWAGLPAALAGLAALALLPGWRKPWPLSPGMTALCLALGLLWAGATGAHHLVYSTADWQIRDAVLHDLAAGPWPVAYAEADGTRQLLRAPLGFYLPAGLLGRVGGFRAAQAALWIWTGLGFGLVLMGLAPVARAVAPLRPRRGFAAMAGVFVLFHGLDLLPNLWLDVTEGPGPLAAWGRGGEWWARLFQYSGHVTAVLWAPNHALPAWLLALLVLRHGAHPRLLRGLALPLAAGAFWSPVAALGAVLLPRARTLRATARRVLSAGNLLAVAFAVPFLLYMVAGSAAVPHGPLLARHPAGQALVTWALFVAVEVLGWAAPVAVLVRGRVLGAAVAMLLLLPAYVFGPGNEMTARGGMAPLAVLAVAVAAALLAPAGTPASATGRARARRLARAALLACLPVAALGALAEGSLLLAKPAWPASTHCPLPEAARQSVFDDATDWAHYLVPWPEPRLRPWLRDPAVRPGGADTPCWPAALP